MPNMTVLRLYHDNAAYDCKIAMNASKAILDGSITIGNMHFMCHFRIYEPTSFSGNIYYRDGNQTRSMHTVMSPHVLPHDGALESFGVDITGDGISSELEIDVSKTHQYSLTDGISTFRSDIACIPIYHGKIFLALVSLVIYSRLTTSTNLHYKRRLVEEALYNIIAKNRGISLQRAAQISRALLAEFDKVLLDKATGSKSDEYTGDPLEDILETLASNIIWRPK